MMQNSIRAKLFGWIISLILIFFLFSLLFTSYLFKPFFVLQQKSKLVETCEMLAPLYLNDNETLYLEIERAERMNGYQIAITDAEGQLFYGSAGSPAEPHRPLGRVWEGITPKPNRMPPSPLGIAVPRLSDASGDEPYVFDTHIDSILDATILNIFYFTDNGVIQINRPVASIDQSIATANQFNFAAGIINLILGIIAAYLIAKAFTKPINELNSIAQSMSRLDFSHKYDVKSSDEIGELGGSINSLSDQLSRSISDLRKANQLLQEDIEKERKIDEMRKEFIANVSHELRTPISLIKGYAEGLADDVADNEESRRFYCEVIGDEVMKMEKHVSNLLQLSQLQTGNIPLEITLFDVSELLRAICAKYKTRFEEERISCSFHFARSIMVYADKGKTEQIILNYLNNAINHTAGERSIGIQINFTYKGKIRIQVRNSGPRIGVDDQKKIWDSYYKVDKARTRRYGGYGLGLSIVKAIQEKYDNGFGVENSQRGVIFWFELDPA